VLYRGANNLVAHECILEFRPWKKHGIEVEDVAKRLIDYGTTRDDVVPRARHAYDRADGERGEVRARRFCDALIAIHGEMAAVASGEVRQGQQPLKHAPHTAAVVCATAWDHLHPRNGRVPDAHTRAAKFWPAVGRVDNVYGERNLVCSCVGMEAFAEAKA
jgi:glycine dehydrogenase